MCPPGTYSSTLKLDKYGLKKNTKVVMGSSDGGGCGRVVGSGGGGGWGRVVGSGGGVE